MAEQKSFILYVDNYQFLEELSNEDKSRWLDAVFLYKRDGAAPHFQKGTPLSLAWRCTKAQLDRDAETWEAIRQKRAEAGRKGGYAKAGKAKQSLAKLGKGKQSLAKLGKGKQSLANLAVNVNDNVNVNIKETSRGEIADAPPLESEEDDDRGWEEYKKEQLSGMGDSIE